jgi:DNA (cytosine-5)-methyltransferase 1
VADVVDLFAGPGGWDEGLRALGITDVEGIEKDPTACATAEAAGHARRQADIALVNPLEYRGITGKIASPPCPGFSAAGKGLGRKDFPILTDAIAAMAGGVPADTVLDIVRARQHDPRSALTLEPLRWALALEPEWIALEQVKEVLPLWEAYAAALQKRGYHVWTGKVFAEQYGVPQTRIRAVLMASRKAAVDRPTPTHSRYYSHSPAKLDEGVTKWVSMAEALGWGMTARPSMTVTGGGTATGGAEPFGNAARQGMHREADAGRWLLKSRRDSDAWTAAHGSRENRAGDRPAPTITGEAHRWSWQPVPAIEGEQAEAITWPFERPSPTIVGSFAPDVVAAPGYRKAGDPPRQKTPGSVRITVQEAAVLQAFRPGYPFQGKQGQQFRQVGDAVPPLMAAHILSALTGCPVLQEAAA